MLFHRSDLYVIFSHQSYVLPSLLLQLDMRNYLLVLPIRYLTAINRCNHHRYQEYCQCNSINEFRVHLENGYIFIIIRCLNNTQYKLLFIDKALETNGKNIRMIITSFVIFYHLLSQLAFCRSFTSI